MARWAGAARRYGSVIWNDQELPQLTEQALASTPHRKWIEQVLQQGADPTGAVLCMSPFDYARIPGACARYGIRSVPKVSHDLAPPAALGGGGSR